MILVVRMGDEFLAAHQACELLPVGFGEAVDPDFAIGTRIGIAGAGGGMAVAEAAHLVTIADDAKRAVNRRHTDIEHGNLDLAPTPGALAFQQRREDAGREMHPRTGVDERGGDAHARPVSIAGHADNAGGGLDSEIHRAELGVTAVAAIALAGAIDEARELLREVVITEAEAFQRARSIVLEDDV